MELFTLVLCLIWGILNTILFFKVWNACNNVKRIADKYAPEIINQRTPETREEIDMWLQNK